MSKKESKSSAETTNKRSRIWLGIAVAIIVTWLGVAAVGGPYFGRIKEVSSDDLSTFLPKSAESTEVKDEMSKFVDSSTIPLIAVFEADNKLSTSQKDILNTIRDKFQSSGVAADEISPPVVSDDQKAAFMVVPLDSEGDLGPAVARLKELADSTKESMSHKFTGPAMFSRDLSKAFAGIDGTLLAVALVVVFVILLIVYRSPILPLVTLSGAVIALSAAILVIWHLAQAGLVQLNGQVQGILFILVIGATTDYSLLYIARYREELIAHKNRWLATKIAWRSTLEPVIAAGGTVTLGLLCLLFSDLGSNKALGPAGGIGIVFAMVTALTFLPAALALLGRVAFWPKPPRHSRSKKPVDYLANHPAWAKVGALVSRHPRRLWVGITAVLLVACLAVPQLNAEGVSQENLIVSKSEAREGQALLDHHFASGAGSPAFVLAPVDKQDEVVELLDSSQSVDAVSVVTIDPDQSPAPLGQADDKLRQKITDEINSERDKQLVALRQSIDRQMAGAPEAVIQQAYQAAAERVPTIAELVKRAYPFTDVSPKVVDDMVLLQATLTHPGSSVEARDAIAELRQKTESQYPSVKFGGVSAIQLDTNIASERDLVVIIPLVLLAITIVLMLLLRSIVAPLLLLLTTVISFGATLGVAALLFNHVWKFPGADPAVLIFSFVFLVALGIDYNIFLMSRVREETKKLGVRAGTLKALVVTGGVITSAGIVLAATFAALYVIPILFLVQIAFIVAFGVLLDTLIVRSLLVPALTLEVGRPMWWPSRLWSKGKR